MEQAVAVLPADNLSTAKDFYVRGLGFSVLFEASDDGLTGLLGVERNGMRVTIDCPMDGHGRGACVSLLVDSADAYYEEWRSRVDIPRAPKIEEWGARTFSVHDPAGNTIFVIEERP